MILEEDKPIEYVIQGNLLKDATFEIQSAAQIPRILRSEMPVNCLFNHATRDCRSLFYEICGLYNHVTYDCKWCVPWNTGPELCAAQVENQSFFFIEECINPRVVREKECSVVFTMLNVQVTSKQIEVEFMNLAESVSWKWNAR